jgi:hypothetical protein
MDGPGIQYDVVRLVRSTLVYQAGPTRLARDALERPRIRAQCGWWLAGSGGLVVAVGEEPSAVAGRKAGRKQTSGEGLAQQFDEASIPRRSRSRSRTHPSSTSHREYGAPVRFGY